MDDLPRYSILVENSQFRIVDLRGCHLDRETVARIIKGLLQSYKLDEEEVVSPCVYLMQRGSSHEYKIGMTSKSPEIRLGSVRSAENDWTVHLVHTIDCENTEEAYLLESMLHEYFESCRIGGEWFELDDIDVVDFQSLERARDWLERWSSDRLANGELRLVSFHDIQIISKLLRLVGDKNASDLSNLPLRKRQVILELAQHIHQLAERIEAKLKHQA